MMKNYEEITFEIIKFNVYVDTITASQKANDDEYGESGSDWEDEQ